MNSTSQTHPTILQRSKQYRSRILFLATGALVACMCAGTLQADTWSDASGNFKIEAEYAGVEGSTLLLKRPDGSTLRVPISKLSDDSRQQAKRLYQMSKSGGAAAKPEMPAASSAAPAASSAASSSVESSPARKLNFTPPAVTTVPALPPFPENASLQETSDFIETQLMAGHPEVFWHALPKSMRDAIDSEEFRGTIREMIEDQAAVSTGVEDVMLKLVEVLVSKKDFVLNSQMMSQVPPPFIPIVQQAYDPATGLLYEFTVLSTSTEKMATMSMTDWFNEYGPRIGGHAQALIKLVPPQFVDSFREGIQITEQGDTGTVSMPEKGGGVKTTEMMRYQGRWVPKELGEQLQQHEGNLIAEFKKMAADAREKSQKNEQQTQAAVGMFTGMANGVLQPMLNAKTQAEFDQALMQVIGMMGMFGGGGGAPAF